MTITYSRAIAWRGYFRSMVYLLKALANSPARPAPPQRRRTIIIGAGPTGISAAFHLGEHSLLLERRAALEESYDYSHDLPMGAARSSSLGVEDGGTDGQRPGASAAERRALFIACSTTSEAAPGGNSLIHVARWRAPEFQPGQATHDDLTSDARHDAGSVRALVPLLRGELLLGAFVVRVSPSLHLLELYDGTRFVYDKLLCTVPLAEVTFLVAHELASRISHDEFLQSWLKEHDIEVSDRANQFREGDIDEVAAGKRMAANINRSLAERFQARRLSNRRGLSFFPTTP